MPDPPKSPCPRLTESTRPVRVDNTASAPSHCCQVIQGLEQRQMAQQVVTTLIDDLDGSEAADTITIGYKGYTYELDLSEKNAAKLEKVLAPFVQAGRRVGRLGGGGSRTTRETTTKRVPSDSTAVRAWAQANGVDVPARGRIPNAVREKFEAAQAH